jgi:hypothetical protein
MKRLALATVGLAFLATLLAAPAAAGPAAPPTDAAPAEDAAARVEARIEQMTYPVNQKAMTGRYEYLKPNPRLAGKKTYTTTAVVLENEYIRAVVLPEFGGRLPRVTFKKPKRDLLWVHDVLEDNLPWSMGGARFTFPFYEHGRHLDETAGWRIIRHGGGGVTVAMDLRFTQYTGADELKRYGRFSTLRQAVFVSLRPGESFIEYTARIDSRLPLRHGFRSWAVTHWDRVAGATVLLPLGGATGHGAPSLQAWPEFWPGRGYPVLGDWGTSIFSVDTQGDWAGVYYPGADANHLVLKDRFTVPGTKLYCNRLRDDKHGRWDEMIEIWEGSNHVFEHPGHYLPPFGNYTMPLRLAMVTGVGRLEWTNTDVAVGLEVGPEVSTIRVLGYRTVPRVRVVARTRDGQSLEATGTLSPDEPLAVEVPEGGLPVRLMVLGADGRPLAGVRVPWRPEPTPEDKFLAVQREMKPWTPLAMELSDWPREHAPNVANAAQTLVKALPGAGPETVVQAARLVLRTREPGSSGWRLVAARLDNLVRREPENQYANLYLAMMRTVENRGTVPPSAVPLLEAAPRLPAARYFLGLKEIADGNLAGAVDRLAGAVAETPQVTLGLGKVGLPGNERLHPAAQVGGEWAHLVRAAVLIRLRRGPAAVAALDRMLLFDPARPEAVALLAEAAELAGRGPRAQGAREAADDLFRMNDEAKRDLDRVRREAATGIWSGIPQP